MDLGEKEIILHMAGYSEYVPSISRVYIGVGLNSG
jgi:hypothetical protein